MKHLSGGRPRAARGSGAKAPAKGHSTQPKAGLGKGETRRVPGRDCWGEKREEMSVAGGGSNPPNGNTSPTTAAPPPINNKSLPTPMR